MIITMMILGILPQNLGSINSGDYIPMSFVNLWAARTFLTSGQFWLAKE
jgi:hypothetical protein